MTERRYFVGLDLGQASQFTALAVLSRHRVHSHDPPHARRPPYELGHLARFPPGTPYPEIFAEVRTLLRTPPLPGNATLVTDYTGVGLAVLRLMDAELTRQVNARRQLAAITGGYAVVRDDLGTQVPRKELAGVLQVLLQTRRLQVAASLPEAELLADEMLRFQMQASTMSADSIVQWREGQHDDLVLAVGIAAWVGERALPPLVDSPTPAPLRYVL